MSPGADDVHDSSWSPSHIGDGFAASVRQFDGATSSDGTGHITRLASIDSFDSKWIKYRVCGASREVGSDNVYNSARLIRSKNDFVPNVNMTWLFPVVGAYEYLTRLHFCDISSISPSLLYFNVYVNGYLAYKDLDLSYITNSLASLFYADFVVDGGDGALSIGVGPSRSSLPHLIDGILNAVEVMKLNNSLSSLDGEVCADFVMKSWSTGNSTGVLFTLVAPERDLSKTSSFAHDGENLDGIITRSRGEVRDVWNPKELTTLPSLTLPDKKSKS
ncbi:hypothetical protein VNO80_13676 [Phaseolus coccineus]|uniref:Malectin-like domain-containing protein n=1 Tax=Phaseolus coccineus TaxID=3886 RepID=A0AAN9N753_PHACN